MTAAVASPPVPSSPVPGTRTDRSAADLRAVPAEHPRLRGLPYLTPVPESEPPFDDEPGAGAATAATAPPAAGTTAGQPAATPSAVGTLWGARPAAGVSGERIRGIGTRAARPGGAAAPPDGPLSRPTGAPLRERPTAPRRIARDISASSSPVGLDGGPTTITAPGVPSWSSESDIGVRRTATMELPPARRAASVFARALVEVLSGRRPLAQLRVHCAPDIYAGLVDRPPAGSLSLPHLLTVRVCEPADGVAEVSAAFRRADRVRALAFRIQGVDGRWRITALQIG